MSRYLLTTITNTITTAIGLANGRSLVVTLATRGRHTLGFARTLMVRLAGGAPAALPVVALHHEQAAAQRAAHAQRQQCSRAMWQRWSLRPAKPGPGAKSKGF